MQHDPDQYKVLPEDAVLSVKLLHRLDHLEGQAVIEPQKKKKKKSIMKLPSFVPFLFLTLDEEF